MAQALCWLAARLAGLAGVIATDDHDVLLLTGQRAPVPAWLVRVVPPAGLVRLLRWAGTLRPGEEPQAEAALSAAARLRLAASGRARAEYMPGVVAGFRSRVLREAADFSVLKARALALGRPPLGGTRSSPAMVAWRVAGTR